MRSSVSVLAVPSVVAMSLTFAPSASAHDQLVSTTPTAGSTLSKTPSALSLTFNNAPMSIGSEIVVKAPDGKQQTLKPKSSGTAVSVPFTPSAGNGRYQIVWRVVSGDGHPISGEFDFTLTGASSASATSSTASSANRTSPKANVSPAGTKERKGNDSSIGWMSGGVAVAVLALAGGGALWLKGRRTQEAEGPNDEAHADDE